MDKIFIHGVPVWCEVKDEFRCRSRVPSIALVCEDIYPGTGCVLCVLSCVVSGGVPDILLTTDSGRPAVV